jgi:hypothetical protein
VGTPSFFVPLSPDHQITIVKAFEILGAVAVVFVVYHNPLTQRRKITEERKWIKVERSDELE